MTFTKPGLLILYFIFITAATRSFGQVTNPAPYDISHYLGKNDNLSIKRKVLISDYSNYTGTRKDTLSIEEYDKAGNKITSTSFSQGKRGRTVSYTYYPKAKLKIWREPELGRQEGTIDRCWYYSKDKIDHFENASFLRGDTTGRDGARFTYNKDSLLTIRNNMINGKVYMTQTYRYKGKDLVNAETKYLSGNAK